MPTYKFSFWVKPKADAPAPLYFVFRHKAARLVFPTAFRVCPMFWDEKKQQIKNVTSVPEKDVINATVSQILSSAKIYFYEQDKANTFTTDGLKSHLHRFTDTVPEKDKPITFLRFFQNFIETSNGRIKDDGQVVAPATVAKYQTTLNLLGEFLKEHPQPFDFENINLDFYAAFTKFLSGRKHRKGNGYTPNAVGKHIQVFKTVLNVAKEKGLAVNLDYQSKKFRAVKQDSDNVYLDEAELKILYEFDLSDKPSLERARDMFLVGCWTGLRFSDLSALRPEKHIKNGLIEIDQQKTGEKAVIPVLAVTAAILEKYGGKMPPAISNQRFNDYVKDACRLAGICERVQKSETRSGRRVTLFFQKWQMVSAHTCRRSFVTNFLKRRAAPQVIMSATGHQSTKHFGKYIKTKPHENAAILKDIATEPAPAQQEFLKLKVV